jgi:hypothetical protein
VSSQHNYALFLGYATAIATFSAAAVALGLLYCVGRRQQVVAVAILLFAILGVAGSLIAVAKHHSAQGLNILIACGFVATGGYVLYAALCTIFIEPGARNDHEHGYWLWLHKHGAVERRPVIAAFSGTGALLVILFLTASPSLFRSLTHEQAGRTYAVMNAAEGVYWRSKPNWSAAKRINGFGVYNGTVIEVHCFESGTPVEGSPDTMWVRATDVGGPGYGSGWLNEHFVNDGEPIGSPAPGIPPCVGGGGNRRLRR